MRTIAALLIFVGFLSKASGQDLNSYIQEALDNSPEVQAFELKYERAKEKVNESNTYPNTQFGLGYFASEPETRTGAQKFKLSATQMFPWFGSITARENYANAVADAEYEDIAITKRKLVMAVAQSYYKLYAIRAKQEVLRENIELLETHEELALIAVKVGKASSVDVLRIQIRENELDEKIQVFDRDFIAEQSAFNNLLNRNDSISVEVVKDMAFPLVNSLSDTDLTLHPELVKYDKLFESVEQANLLNNKDNKPQIGLGLDYINVAKRPDMTFDDNGKDILMPMVTVSIPIFNKKYKSIDTQYELQQQEIRMQQQNRLNTLRTLLDKALETQAANRISYKTLEENLKQTKDAEAILTGTYETGLVDFDDVLDVQELQLKFQVAQIEAIKSFYIQQSIVNYLIL